MSKKKKLYNLRLSISCNAVRIKHLLENAIYKSDSVRETNILETIALELAEKIAVSSKKIGKILKH